MGSSPLGPDKSMNSSVKYHHTQIGYTSLAVMLALVIAAALGTFAGLPALSSTIVFSLIAIPCILISMFMYGLTITIDDEHLSWHFGLNSFRKKVSLSDIKGVEVVENTDVFGYGVRYTKRGTLYNVSGKRAVAVRLKTPWKKDKEILLGTDRPEELQLALKACIDKRKMLAEHQETEMLTFGKKPIAAQRK